MRNHLLQKRLTAYICLVGVVWVLFLFFSCKREEKGGEIKPPEKATQETEAQLSRLTGELMSLQEPIRQEPMNSDLRLKLLATAVNEQQQWIRAAGIGLIPPDSPNLSVATQGAERAAFLDACRWIAYLKAWRKDPLTPDFGQISGQIPPAKIIYKHSAPDQVVVLVEAELR